jgi:hypothetical protein
MEMNNIKFGKELVNHSHQEITASKSTAVTSQKTSILSHIILQLFVRKHLTNLRYTPVAQHAAIMSTQTTMKYKKI